MATIPPKCEGMIKRFLVSKGIAFPLDINAGYYLDILNYF